MGVRAIVNRNPALVVAMAALCLGLVGWIWYVSAREGGGEQGQGSAKAWYTVDDGRTSFADAPNKVVPFEHQGKQAYRCFVWTCDGGSTKFISHLERLSARARQQLAGRDKVDPWEVLPGSTEVKAPLTGDRGWLNADAREAAEIQIPRCPDAKPGTPKPVPAE